MVEWFKLADIVLLVFENPVDAKNTVFGNFEAEVSDFTDLNRIGTTNFRLCLDVKSRDNQHEQCKSSVFEHNCHDLLTKRTSQRHFARRMREVRTLYKYSSVRRQEIVLVLSTIRHVKVNFKR